MGLEVSMTLSVSLAQTPPIQHLQQGGVTIRITVITIRENRILIDLKCRELFTLGGLIFY